MKILKLTCCMLLCMASNQLAAMDYPHQQNAWFWFRAAGALSLGIGALTYYIKTKYWQGKNRPLIVEEPDLPISSPRERQLPQKFGSLFGARFSHAITENFKPPKLAVPAPSLVRLRKISAATLTQKLMSLHHPPTVQDLRLVAITDSGDLFFCNRQSSRELIVVNSHEERGLSQKQRQMQYGYQPYREKGDGIEVVSLPDNWRIPAHYWTMWKNFSCIPFIRTIAAREEQGGDNEEPNHPLIELARFDVNSHSLRIISRIGANEWVRDMGTNCAIVARIDDLNWIEPGIHNDEEVALLSSFAPADFYLVGPNHQREWLCHSGNSNIFFPCALDPVHDRVVFAAIPSDDLYIKDLTTAASVKLPTQIPKCHVHIQTVGNLSIITCTGNDGSLQQWSYDGKNWHKLLSHKLTPGTLPVLSAFHIDTHNTIAINTCPYSYIGIIPKLPRIITLASGEVIQDNFNKSESSYNHTCVILASENSKYIALQTGSNDILVWKVRGANLPNTCTLSDRLALHELQQHYTIGQQRNKKYNRNYVIRLDERQYTTFQRLLRRQECEVPYDWARLFRPLKKKQQF